MDSLAHILVNGFIILTSAVFGVIFLCGIFVWMWESFGEYRRSKRRKGKNDNRGK